MIAKHPCVRVFLNGILHASKSFRSLFLCSGSWTTSMPFTVWSQRVPQSPLEVFDRYKALSWDGEK